MSDDEMSDNDQPPALEDADIDDVSSGASVVTESSDSVSIDTEDETSERRGRIMDDDESNNDGMDDSPEHQQDGDEAEGALGPAFVVPLKTGSDDEDEDCDRPSKATPGRMRRRRSVEDREEVLERNSLRRQRSNEMLTAMRAAAMSADEEEAEGADAADNAPRRAPPGRTKSGDLLNGGAAEVTTVPRRRPPPRTKSGDGLGGGGDDPPRRRPPARTKSGDGLAAPDELRPVRRAPSGPGNLETEEASDFVVALRGDSDDDDDFLMSPSSRRRRTSDDRDTALSRNAVRRQASSDMLRAMSDSTQRAPPVRAKSSAAALQRKPPPRTKSGLEAVGDDSARPAPRRRPPARTKSGDGLGGGDDESGAEPRRRPPSRTKSGAVFQPTTAVIEE
jgi:hypothetical protein